MLASLKLYKDRTPTPIQRFSDKDSLLGFLSSSYGIGIDSSDVLSQSLYPTSLRGSYGTSILNTYIDILITQQEVKDYLDAFSYAFVTNNDNGVASDYLFFVDRIERSMIDDNTIQARFYLTLDVWDTFILHHNREPHVEGEVLRAHVNDIVNGYPTTEYTTYERECDVYNSQYVTDNTGNANPATIAYLHVAMINRQGAGFDRYDYYEGRVTNKQSFTSSLFHVVVPFNPATFNTIGINDTTSQKNLNVSLNFIDDVGIVSMFVSTETPYYLVNKYNPETGIFNIGDGDGLATVEIGSGRSIYGIQTGALTTGSQALGSFSFDDVFKFPMPKGKEGDDPYILKTSAESYAIAPISYESYVRDYQMKFYSAVYNPVVFNISDNTIVLDAMQQNVEGRAPISWQYDYDTGDIFIWETNSSVISRYTSTERFSLDNSVTPYRQSNEVITLSLFKALTGGFAQTVSSASRKDMFSAAVGAVDLGTSIAEADIKRRTPKSTKGTGYLNTMVQTAIPYLTYYRYRDRNMSVRRDLYLYGYTTNLCIDDILENHKRKYFNYIKANDMGNVLCLESLPSYLIEDIRNMFINGVYLWNTFDTNIFSYKVVNYPLSSGW